MKKFIYKKSLLEDLRMSLLDFNFVMVYLVHIILTLLKNHLNYIRENIFECFFKKYNRLLIFLTTHNDGKSKVRRRKNNWKI